MITEVPKWQTWMAHSYALAKRAWAQGEVPIGASLWRQDQCLGEGWNQNIQCHDPSAHAEIMALRQAGQRIKNHRLIDTTMVLTLEPCLMCYQAMVHARVATVIFAAADAKVGVFTSGLVDTLPTNHRLAWHGPVDAERGAKLLSDFFPGATMTRALIIGAGAAGLSAALSLADHLPVVLLTKGAYNVGATRWAQGGIAALMTPQDHASFCQDIWVAGAKQGDQAVIDAMVTRSIEAFHWCVDQGIEFTKSNAQWHLNQEGGHAVRRILHVDDATGKALSEGLWRQVMKHPNITHVADSIAADLVVMDGQCVGVKAWHTPSQTMQTWMAGQVILATGGASHVYAHTTHSDALMGDGMAMAHRAGCPLKGLAFNQFHPTCLYHDAPLLLTEALRGEGAVLRNHAGQAFMAEAHPSKDLAPRDVVARAILKTMHTDQTPHVWLDITHMDADRIRVLFPTLCQRLQHLGFDLTRDWIPVLPAAHYTCGGIEAKMNGQTSLPGLYAIGEVASTGLHGANRLASTSLLECLVMGRAVAEPILADPHPSQPNVPAIKAQRSAPNVEHMVQHARNTMSQVFGVVRTVDDCRKALAWMIAQHQVLEHHYQSGAWDRALIEARHAFEISICMINQGLNEKKSLGLHHWSNASV